VKKATTRLRVTLSDRSTVEGSGFFGGEPNLVFTNAHVLGMLGPHGRKPSRIAVIIFSGQDNEATLDAELLGVDSRADLAVLRVPGRAVPPPLEFSPGADLRETQEVYILGFPFGDALGRDITVSKSSVSSLRRIARGTLEKIQVNGGMHPGNSGGPVVNGQGQVIGVAVSGLARTQIHFAVPADHASDLLEGRFERVDLGYPTRDGDKVRLTVQARFCDPLRRIRSASLECWKGAVGANPPKPGPSDIPHASGQLIYSQGIGHGELVLPPLGRNEVYWIQPVYETRTRTIRKVQATSYQPETPADPSPCRLGFRPQFNARSTVTLDCTGAFRISDGENAERRMASHVRARFGELAGDDLLGDNMLPVRVSYQQLQIDTQLDGRALPETDPLRQAAADAPYMTGEYQFGDDGRVEALNGSAAGVPPRSLGELPPWNDFVLQALELTAAPLPEREVLPGESWTADRHLHFSLFAPSDPIAARIRYQHVGRRVQAGHSEAIVSFSGSFTASKETKTHQAGRINGYAAVDVTSGQVRTARATIELEMEPKTAEGSKSFVGTLDVSLQRSFLDLPAAKRGAAGGKSRQTTAPDPGLEAAADAKSAVEGEWKQIEGRWRLLRKEAGGVLVHGQNRHKQELLIENESILWVYDGRPTRDKAEVTIDPTTNPKSIDLEMRAGRDTGKIMRGIYQLRGNKLVLCWNVSGQKGRPKKFTTQEPGIGGTTCEVYELQKESEERAGRRDKDPKELKKLEGRWTLTRAEEFGKDFKATLDLLIEDDAVRMLDGDRVKVRATIELGTNAKTRTIDLVLQSGASAGKIQLGIYRLQGETLELCLNGPGDEQRPSRFSTKAEAGAGKTRFVFQRVKND
jgi:uncharacterized protein (TIGR03067 family)